RFPFREGSRRAATRNTEERGSGSLRASTKDCSRTSDVQKALGRVDHDFPGGVVHRDDDRLDERNERLLSGNGLDRPEGAGRGALEVDDRAGEASFAILAPEASELVGVIKARPGGSRFLLR